MDVPVSTLFAINGVGASKVNGDMSYMAHVGGLPQRGQRGRGFLVSPLTGAGEGVGHTSERPVCSKRERGVKGEGSSSRGQGEHTKPPSVCVSCHAQMWTGGVPKKFPVAVVEVDMKESD
jgi:hypothetical protein